MTDAVECPHCGEQVQPSPIIARDPRTGRDRHQHICPECGLNIKAGGGRFV